MTWRTAELLAVRSHLSARQGEPQDRVEFLAVANWRNYQPLEAGENIRKGNKVTPKGGDSSIH